LGMALPSDAAHGYGHVSRSGGGMKTTNNTLGILVMSNQLKKKVLAAAIATVGAMPVFAYAQAHAGHAGHTPAPPTTSAPATASGMSHGSMNMSDKDHGSMGMPGMDHGSMDMSGMDHGAGKAPAQGHDAMRMPMKQADPSKSTSAMPGMSHGQS